MTIDSMIRRYVTGHCVTIQNVISDFVTSRDVTYQGMIFQNVIYPSVTSQSTTNSSVKSHFVISRSVTSTGVTIKNVTFSVTCLRKSFKKGMATLHFRLSIIEVKLELNSNKHDPETKKYFVCIICKMSSLENDNDACLLTFPTMAKVWNVYWYVESQ